VTFSLYYLDFQVRLYRIGA